VQKDECEEKKDMRNQHPGQREFASYPRGGAQQQWIKWKERPVVACRILKGGALVAVGGDVDVPVCIRGLSLLA
jgi:hypothetical protein